MNSHTTLPYELYRPIIDGVGSKRDLCALARSCSAFQPEAETLLYRSLVLDGDQDILSMCQHVSDTPRIRPYVEDLHVISDSISANGFYILRSKLATMFGYIHNLRRLEIFVPRGPRTGGTYQPLCGDLWEQCRFQLIKLRSPFKLDKPMLSFLRTQSEVRDIWIDSNTPIAANIPLDVAVPKLSVLRCDIGIVSAPALQPRNVTHIHVSTVFGPCAPVQSLKAVYAASMTQALVAMAPRLEILTCISGMVRGLPTSLMYSKSLTQCTFQELEDGEYRKWLSFLTSFKHLRKLEINSHWVELPTTPLAAMEDFHKACPSLRDVRLHYEDDRMAEWTWKEDSECWDHAEMREVGNTKSFWEESVDELAI
jgi:hypothetical protein